MTIGEAGRFPVRAAMGLAYGAQFFALGVYLPFFPLWLSARGLSAQDIGVAVAVPLSTRLVSTPLLGVLSDRLGRPKALLVLLAAFTAVTMSLLMLAQTRLAILVVLGCRRTGLESRLCAARCLCHPAGAGRADRLWPQPPLGIGGLRGGQCGRGAGDPAYGSRIRRGGADGGGLCLLCGGHRRLAGIGPSAQHGHAGARLEAGARHPGCGCARRRPDPGQPRHPLCLLLAPLVPRRPVPDGGGAALVHRRPVGDRRLPLRHEAGAPHSGRSGF